MPPAREVQGVLLAPDGQAAANVAIKGLTRLSESTKVPSKDHFQSQVISKTDEQGRFRLVVAATGAGRFWFFPTDNASLGLVADEAMTDAGVVTLESGFLLKDAGSSNSGIPGGCEGAGPSMHC